MDIVEAAGSIESFLEGVSRETFLSSDLIQSAVLQKLTLIGEAAARVSPETRSRFPNVPWSSVVGLRNILVHAYFSVDWELVWNTATTKVPVLRQQVSETLTNL